MRFRSILIALTFLMTFVVEVRVKAAETVQFPSVAYDQKSNLNELIEEPTGCLSQTGSCAFATPSGKKFSVVISGATLTLDQRTQLLRVSATEFQLLRGTVWLHTDLKSCLARVKIASQYATVEASLTEGSDFWVTHTDERTEVSSAARSGELKIISRGSVQRISVLPGTTSSVGKVGANGFAETSLPLAIDYELHIARWARLFTGNKKDFLTHVKAFQQLWNAASVKVAALHQSRYEMKKNELTRAAEIASRQREAKRDRDLEVNRLFRRRSLAGE